MFTSTAFSSQDIVRDGLVLWLDANDKTSYPGSGTVWRDLSRGGNNGILTNGPTFNYANGGSIVFDGVDDYSWPLNDLTTLPSGDSNRTMTYWIYPLSVTSTLLTQIAGWGLNTNPGSLFCGIIWSNGKAGIWGTSNNYMSTHDITINSWQQITYVKTPGTIICYKNGVADSGGGYSLNTVANSRPYIGRVFNSSIYNYYNGRISNFQIYNRALTAQEVSQNFNATKSRFGL